MGLIEIIIILAIAITLSNVLAKVFPVFPDFYDPDYPRHYPRTYRSW